MRSFEGRLTDRHLFLLKQIQQHIEWLDDSIARIDDQVAEGMSPYRQEWELLQTHPGIDQIAAAMILAEIGVSMEAFGNKERISCWAGMSPGNNESAKKAQKRSHITWGQISQNRTL